MSYKICWTVLILSLGMFFIIGCGTSKVPGRVPGQGNVLYDGKPLAWAIVTFTPKTNTPGTRVATAQTDVNGLFSLNTLGEKGILPGDYMITTSKDIKDEGPQSVENWKKSQAEGGREPVPEEGVYNVVSVIPKKFTLTQSSEMEVNIPPKGKKDIKIEIQTSF